jgi:hypothetical protein
MNYRTINNRLILKILLVAFIICFVPDSVLGDDFALYPTGLLPPTEEEKKLMEKEWKKIDKVIPNEIAIDRINNRRREANLPELNQEEVELIWQDNIDELKREFGLNSRQLAYSGDLGRLNRRKSAACSGRSRPPKPEQSGHRSERSDAGFNYFSNF